MDIKHSESDNDKTDVGRDHIFQDVESKEDRANVDLTETEASDNLLFDGIRRMAIHFPPAILSFPSSL